MRLNIENLNKIKEEKYYGNLNLFAKQIGIDRSQLFKVLNEGKCAGIKFYERLIDYCQKNNIDMNSIIFFE